MRGRACRVVVALGLMLVACRSNASPDRATPLGSESALPAGTGPSGPPRHFTLAAVGDILLHDSVIQDGRANAGGKGYNFDPMFDDVRALISGADIAICH